MRLLLDTHIFLWYISADSQLPVALRDAIRDPANEVYLSVASVLEAATPGSTLPPELSHLLLIRSRSLAGEMGSVPASLPN
jgi:hypothetical protein